MCSDLATYEVNEKSVAIHIIRLGVLRGELCDESLLSKEFIESFRRYYLLILRKHTGFKGSGNLLIKLHPSS